jgi:type IV pilus assembly protein PilW
MSMSRSGSLPVRQLGLSLVELMVAVVVGLLLIGGLIQVYLSSKQSYNAQEQLARMQEGGRFAMELITSDLRRTGYWGGNVDLTTIQGAPGPAVPDNTCNDGRWGRMVNWRVFGLNQNEAPGGYTCATGHIAGTDILTVRYARSETIADAAVPADNGLFLRTTMFRGRVMTGAQKDATDNEIPPEDPVFTPQHLLPVVHRIVSHAYYVGDSGLACPGGQAIPALRRVRLDATTGLPVAENVATGVEHLQVRFLLNGEYRDADDVPAADWPNVQAVRVWMLMRGECPEPGLENDTTYTMGDTVLAVDDNFRRQLYVNTVMLRNTVVR